MNILKRIQSISILGIMGFLILFPRPAFSEDLSDGYYAGPLSLVEKVVEKKVNPKKPVSEDGLEPEDDEEEDIIKKALSAAQQILAGKRNRDK